MSEQRAKRIRVEQSILSRGCVTRGALTEVLKSLSDAGMLTHSLNDVSKRTTRAELQSAIEHHSHVSTPYGKVVQTMDLGIPELRKLEYVNPFAYLHYLSSISPAFADMMVASQQNPIVFVDYLCSHMTSPTHIEDLSTYTTQSKFLSQSCLYMLRIMLC